MILDSDDIRYIDKTKLVDNDCFVIFNYADPECKGYVRAISFDELCKAVAKQLVKDGAIAGGDE